MYPDKFSSHIEVWHAEFYLQQWLIFHLVNLMASSITKCVNHLNHCSVSSNKLRSSSRLFLLFTISFEQNLIFGKQSNRHANKISQMFWLAVLNLTCVNIWQLKHQTRLRSAVPHSLHSYLGMMTERVHGAFKHNVF